MGKQFKAMKVVTGGSAAIRAPFAANTVIGWSDEASVARQGGLSFMNHPGSLSSNAVSLNDFTRGWFQARPS